MSDKKTALFYSLVCMLVILTGFIKVQSAAAAILSGYFPMHQGKYWNFSCPQETEKISWAINGDFNLRDAGSVFMMYQGNGRVLCMKQDWKGVCVYAEITPDALYLPEKPYLFLPRDIPTEIGAVMEETVTFKIYTSPKKNDVFVQTGSEKRYRSFEFKGSEDIQAGDQQYLFCAVIERITRRNEDEPKKETLWLAQGVGPVKILVESGGTECLYTALSWSGSEKKPKSYSLRQYFPLQPGLRWIYQDQNGNQRVTEIKVPLTSKIAEDMVLMPFEDYLHDIHFVNMQDAGLVMPQKYWSQTGFCQADSDQEKPTVVLPSELQAGVFSLSRSHTISRRWPSMNEMPISDLELIYSSVPMGIEDVKTPAGVFKNCIKIALANTTRAYVVRFDVIRVGYIWLAPDTGIVKEDLVNLYNYSDPTTMHSIFDVRLWELEKVETVASVPVLSYQNEQEPASSAARVKAAVPVKKTVSADGLTWENNSREMYEKALEMTPFFVRPLAKNKMMKSIRTQAGEGKTVSEDVVVTGLRESASKNIIGGVIAEIEKLRMQ